MRLIVLRVAFCALFSICQSVAQPGMSQVSVPIQLLKKHVYLLASDSLQGRATGTKGQRQAALYCASSFRQSHLLSSFRLDSVRGSFRQTFPFTLVEATPFGYSGSYRSSSSSYKRFELIEQTLSTKDSNKVFFGDNVGGLMIGTDLKKEVVIISAHYDHLGRNGKYIFHGADDNASGTATVLSIASVFDSLAQQGFRPRRSILFLLFSGEEGGLLGSKYFVNHSPLNLSQFVCDLNVDMVGRVDDDHRKNPNYCYLITNAQGSKVKTVTKNSNQQSVNLILNQGGYDAENDPNNYFSRSDQYNFAQAGIPALFFTSGLHQDYHQPSDTADKIDYILLKKRATLVFQTAWTMANLNP